VEKLPAGFPITALAVGRRMELVGVQYIPGLLLVRYACGQ
jgi:hypothetical protein